MSVARILPSLWSIFILSSRILETVKNFSLFFKNAKCTKHAWQRIPFSLSISLSLSLLPQNIFYQELASVLPSSFQHRNLRIPTVVRDRVNLTYNHKSNLLATNVNRMPPWRNLRNVVVPLSRRNSRRKCRDEWTEYDSANDSNLLDAHCSRRCVKRGVPFRRVRLATCPERLVTLIKSFPAIIVARGDNGWLFCIRNWHTFYDSVRITSSGVESVWYRRVIFGFVAAIQTTVRRTACYDGWSTVAEKNFPFEIIVSFVPLGSQIFLLALHAFNPHVSRYCDNW